MDNKKTCEHMKAFYKEHRNEILFGMRMAMVKQKYEQALMEQAFEDYKKHVLYEQALDYASK